MNNFEENIRKNKKQFDHRELEKEHLARFILKLEKDQEEFHRKRTPFFALKIAASVIVLMAVSVFLFNYLSPNPSDLQQTQVITFANDIDKAMAYYDEVSLVKMNQIDKLVTNEEEAEKIKKSAYNSLEDIDIRLAAIEKEYMKNPDNKALRAALINNKRKKVEVMEQILLQIDVANTYLY